MKGMMTSPISKKCSEVWSGSLLWAAGYPMRTEIVLLPLPQGVEVICFKKISLKEPLKCAVLSGTTSCIIKKGFFDYALLNIYNPNGNQRGPLFPKRLKFSSAETQEIQKKTPSKQNIQGRKKKKKEKSLFNFRIVLGILKAPNEDLCWSFLIQTGYLSLITKLSLRMFNAYCCCQIQPPTSSRF